MGRPTTLLEGLCGHALSLGAQSIEVEYKDRREWVFANQGGMGIGIANFARSSAEAKELRENLYAAAKKPVRAVIGGQVYLLKANTWPSSTTTPRSTGELQRNRTWSATSRFPRPPFTI
jgi:hypothetical protein